MVFDTVIFGVCASRMSFEIWGFNEPGGIGSTGVTTERTGLNAPISYAGRQTSVASVLSSSRIRVVQRVGRLTIHSIGYLSSVQPNQHAFVLRSGTAGSKVSMRRCITDDYR
jgi:hypothetical protein